MLSNCYQVVFVIQQNAAENAPKSIVSVHCQQLSQNILKNCFNSVKLPGHAIHVPLNSFLFSLTIFKRVQRTVTVHQLEILVWVSMLTNRNKGASELKKGVDLVKLTFSKPPLHPLLPPFKKIK